MCSEFNNIILKSLIDNASKLIVETYSGVLVGLARLKMIYYFLMSREQWIYFTKCGS